MGGEFRTVEISKGIPFCYCANIRAQLDSLLGDLRDEDCLRDIADRETCQNIHIMVDRTAEIGGQ